MDDKDIGRFIRNRRISLDISLEEIANVCGVSKSTVCRWETGGINKIKRSHIYLLSKILFVPAEKILGLETDIPIEDSKLILKRQSLENKLKLVNKIEDLEQIDKFIEAFILKK